MQTSRGRRLRRAAVLTLLVLAAVYATAWVATPYSGIARAVAWLEADTGDIERFPTRQISAGDDPWELGAVVAPRSKPTVAVDGRTLSLETLLDETGTEAFLVARGDDLVYERYRDGRRREDPHTSFSVAKSFLSAAVGAAVAEEHLSLEDPVTDHVPELGEGDERFADITIRDLVTMSSGLAYVERGLPWSDDALTYYSADLRRIALRHAEVVEPPGRWHYNNYNPLIMGLVLERATGESVAALLERTIWQPAGMEGDASWSLDSMRSGFEKMESGINARPIDYLRFGMLYRDGGRRDGRVVLDPEWVAESTAPHLPAAHGAGYGYWWWTGGGGAVPEHVSARGNLGQYIVVFPALDLVMVRMGATYGIDDWPRVFEQLAPQFGT